MYAKDEEKDINLLLSRIKKNPTHFKDKILEKLKAFSQEFERVKQNPGTKNPEFNGYCMFFGQIFEFFPKELSFVLEALMQTFEAFKVSLHPQTRYKLIHMLLVVQKKGFVDFLQSLEFFCGILGFPDKEVRKLVFGHLFHYVKNMVRKKKFGKMETLLSNKLRDILVNSPVEVQTKLLKLLIKLYSKGVWTNPKIVNIITILAEAKDHKVLHNVVRFLITTTEKLAKDIESDDEDEDLNELTKQYSKKYKNSQKKIQKLERQIKNIKKKEKRLEKMNVNSNVFPIDKLYNINAFVDVLMNRLLKEKNLKFAVKMDMMSLLGRIIGRNKLVYPPYQSFVLRYIRPEAPPKLFAFIAESVHQGCSLIELELIVKRLISNFVCEGLSEEKMTIGINTLRLILLRNENAMESEDINYVARFRYYKNKSVSSAAKGFINIIRDLCPDTLDKEFHLYVKANMIDQKVTKKADLRVRVDGAELLLEDGDIDVECDRILTDEDFKKIRKLKQKKIMDRLKGAPEEEKAIKMPETTVEDLKRDYRALEKLGEIDRELNDDEIEELLDEFDEESGEDNDDVDDEDDDEEDNEEDDEEDNEEDDDEDNEEDGEDEELESGEEKGSEMEIEEGDEDEKSEKVDEGEDDEDDEDDEEDDEEDDQENEVLDEDHEMIKRGFITENMVNTYKKSNRRKTEKAAEIFEKLIEKKFATKRKQKKGSKTNKEKEKNKPYMMMINKVHQTKAVVNDMKKRIKKLKNFKGHVGKLRQPKNKGNKKRKFNLKHN